jgi:pentatricopeptide repeat protein
MNKSINIYKQPNSITCSSLIDASLKNGDINRAFIVLHDMRSRGLRPTEVTYTSIITELSKLGSKGMEYISEMMSILQGM